MWGTFCRILLVPQNIVMDLNNVMPLFNNFVMLRKLPNLV